MKPNSKRWRKARLRFRRKLRRVDLRWVNRFPTRFKQHTDDEKVERYNRAVRRLNKNLRRPDGGYHICDGAVECPVCGKFLLTFGDPDAWTRNDNPARLGRSWDVTGYWPGMAECCGLLIAPDFEQQCIVVDEAEYKRARAAQGQTLIEK